MQKASKSPFFLFIRMFFFILKLLANSCVTCTKYVFIWMLIHLIYVNILNMLIYLRKSTRQLFLKDCISKVKDNDWDMCSNLIFKEQFILVSLYISTNIS